jgi:hypothetical protein
MDMYFVTAERLKKSSPVKILCSGDVLWWEAAVEVIFNVSLFKILKQCRVNSAVERYLRANAQYPDVVQLADHIDFINKDGCLHVALTSIGKVS